MRKPNKNSTRQQLLSMTVGEQKNIPRNQIKVASLSALLFSLKRDEQQAYSYATGEEYIQVTRKS